MAKTRALVKRRKAIRNIRKITRTMELIATARFKKAMDRAVEAEAYTRKIAELVADLSKSSGAAAGHPLLADRPTVGRSALLVLTSNRGLCGGYNGNVLKQMMASLADLRAKHPVEVEVSGKRGTAFAKFRQVEVVRTYSEFEDKPTFDQVEAVANRFIEAFLAKRIDRLDVAYTKFLSVGKQQAVVETLLPMKKLDVAGSAAPAGKADDVEFEFVPSPKEILDEIVPVSFKIRLFKCFLDAAVSEQIARMVAMKGATENAGDLIKALTLKYNRARQSQITSEIAEIIGTVEALK
jgi:F-type H+-transporting ATPase subunit gamma